MASRREQDLFVLSLLAVPCLTVHPRISAQALSELLDFSLFMGYNACTALGKRALKHTKSEIQGAGS